MQDNFVKAFRQRLVRGGFTNISIYDYDDGTYVVRCFDRTGKRFCERITEQKMRNIPRLVYFE